jgi:hypothetical protein
VHNVAQRARLTRKYSASGGVVRFSLYGFEKVSNDQNVTSLKPILICVGWQSRMENTTRGELIREVPRNMFDDIARIVISRDRQCALEFNAKI